MSILPTVVYAECHKSALYAKCHYAECHFAECRAPFGKHDKTITKLSTLEVAKYELYINFFKYKNGLT